MDSRRSEVKVLLPELGAIVDHKSARALNVEHALHYAARGTGFGSRAGAAGSHLIAVYRQLQQHRPSVPRPLQPRAL